MSLEGANFFNWRRTGSPRSHSDTTIPAGVTVASTQVHAGREQGAAFADFGVVAVGEGPDHWLGADRSGGRLDLGPGGLGAAEADVVGHRGPTIAKA
jgi:hypothetical protein